MLQQEIVINLGSQPVKWILKKDPGKNIPVFVPEEDYYRHHKRGTSNSPPLKIPHLSRSDSVHDRKGDADVHARGRSPVPDGPESLADPPSSNLDVPVHNNAMLNALDKFQTQLGGPERQERGENVTESFGEQSRRSDDERRQTVGEKRGLLQSSGARSSPTGFSRPLPPHLLLQQRGENVPTPQVGPPLVASGRHDRGPVGEDGPSRGGGMMGRGRGEPDYKTNENLKMAPDRHGDASATSQWRPPTCVGELPATSDSHRSPPSDLHPCPSDIQPFPSNSQPRPSDGEPCPSGSESRLSGGELRPSGCEPGPSAASFRPSGSKSSLPPSPADLIRAEQGLPPLLENSARGGIGPHTAARGIIDAQTSLLDALSCNDADDMMPERSPYHQHQQPIRIPVNPMGLETSDLSNAKTLTLNNDDFGVLNRNPVSVLTEYAQSRKKALEIKVLMQKGPPNKPK